MTTLNHNRPWLRRITAEDVAPLTALAREDQHSVIAATHVFEKDGQLAGCVSFGNIPLVLPWFHTTRCKAADSLYLINLMENLMVNSLPPDHPGLVCVPFMPHSPFAAHRQRLGYQGEDVVHLTFKPLK